MSESFSRSASAEDLKSLLRSLNQLNIRYFLIGGYALAAHGYQRATTDIDLLFPADEATGRLVREALLILPDQASREIDPAWFNEAENIRVSDAFVVDLMFNANGQSYDSLLPFAQIIDFEGVPVQRGAGMERHLATQRHAQRV